jgi:hypothetical protein
MFTYHKLSPALFRASRFRVCGHAGACSSAGQRTATGFVRRSNCPTQAKGRLEWATVQIFIRATGRRFSGAVLARVGVFTYHRPCPTLFRASRFRVCGHAGACSSAARRTATGFVQRANCPTQAKGRLEWATVQSSFELQAGDSRAGGPF